jgi:hypothetical protein
VKQGRKRRSLGPRRRSKEIVTYEERIAASRKNSFPFGFLKLPASESAQPFGEADGGDY